MKSEGEPRNFFSKMKFVVKLAGKIKNINFVHDLSSKLFSACFRNINQKFKNPTLFTMFKIMKCHKVG